MEDQNLDQREISQQPNFQGAEVSTEKNVPHGIRENVPSRGGGVTEGKEENHPFKPQDDLMTEVRRARYGEDPVFVMHPGDVSGVIEQDVNQIMSRTNITRDEVLQGKYGMTGYGRVMSQ